MVSLSESVFFRNIVNDLMILSSTQRFNPKETYCSSGVYSLRTSGNKTGGRNREAPT